MRPSFWPRGASPIRRPEPSIARLLRSRLTWVVARVLLVTLASYGVPFDFARPRTAGATTAPDRPASPPATASAAGRTLYVNSNPALVCHGKTPCFTSIQAAIDAVRAGERIEIQPGEHVEQLRIFEKNFSDAASEADRIVIEAEPGAPPASVMLRGRRDRCEGGFAVDFSRSRYVTLRGLAISGAGVRGIGLRGGSRQNRAIHLERNRLSRGGPRECNGGIDVGRGNPDTVIAHNLIYGNGQDGIIFRDGRGGPYYVIGNTIVGNAWNGVQMTRLAVVELIGSLILGNGHARGAASNRVGVRRLRRAPQTSDQVRLAGNVICGNRGGELFGELLDAEDVGNRTLTGSEGPGLIASPCCGEEVLHFLARAGADGVLDTADDDFRLAPTLPAIDASIDPRSLGYPVSSAVLESDFLRPGGTPA